MAAFPRQHTPAHSELARWVTDDRFDDWIRGQAARVTPLLGPVATYHGRLIPAPSGPDEVARVYGYLREIADAMSHPADRCEWMSINGVRLAAYIHDGQLVCVRLQLELDDYWGGRHED